MADLTAFPELSTPRLRLREITDADSAALFAIHRDPQVRRWFGSDPLSSEDEARALVRAFAGWRELVNPGTRWGLERREAGGLIGSCGLFSWNRQWRKCAIGYELAPPAAGQGLMTEALVAIIDWGFARMDLNRIEAQIHPDNERSIRLATRLGFVEEGRLRELARWGGRHHDMLQFSLLRRDWRRGGPPDRADTIAGPPQRTRSTPMSTLRPFHLAFPVTDLAAARRFYGGLLGCPEGRSSAEWIDFNLYGHQIVAHLSPAEAGHRSTSEVDGNDVPVRHFGVVLSMPEWQQLADRLQAEGIRFVIEPHIRFKGEVGEQATMFFLDPCGNALEFKAFANIESLFAK